MKLSCYWNEKMSFTAVTGSHQVVMDALPPIGSDKGATPKHLLLASIAGCTAMDVIALLRKGRQEPVRFSIDTEAEKTKAHPSTFARVDLVYRVEGEVQPDLLVDAVTKSMTQYCGVSAMVVKACPIHYRIELNGKEIGTGQAEFSH